MSTSQHFVIIINNFYILCKTEECVLVRLTGHNGRDTIKLNTFITLGKKGLIIKKPRSVNSYNKSQGDAFFLYFNLVKRGQDGTQSHPDLASRQST